MERTFIVTDPVGLHARPATLLVSEAAKYASDAFIVVDGKEVNLKSIMGVMSLGIKTNEEFVVRLEGDDAGEGLEAITAVITDSGIGQQK